jgi:hypothetical protein
LKAEDNEKIQLKQKVADLEAKYCTLQRWVFKKNHILPFFLLWLFLILRFFLNWNYCFIWSKFCVLVYVF